MTIQRTTRAAWEEIFAAAVAEADGDIIAQTGPVYAIATRPTATVASRLNEQIRLVSRWLGMVDPDAFVGYQDVLTAILSGEELGLLGGTFSETTLRFSSTTRPSRNLTVPRGSGASTGTGTNRVVFVTTETATLLASEAFAGPDGRYSIDVPARATATGPRSVVAANALRVLTSPIDGFDRVTNPVASTPAVDSESIEQAIERYRLAVTGISLSSPDSIRRIVREEFPGVASVRLLYGTNPRLVRAVTTSGAVDAYAFGGRVVRTASAVTYLGLGQRHLLETAVSGMPLVDVISVRDIRTGTVLVEGTDYVIEFDDGPEGRSVRAQDGLRFLGSSVSLPTLNTPLLVEWEFDQTIRDLQRRFDEDELFVVGRDLLWKRGFDVLIAYEARVVTFSGYSTDTVEDQARQAIVDFIAQLEPGSPVQVFDVEQAIGRVLGVDNVITRRLSRTTAPSGTVDLDFDVFERATVLSADIILEVV